DPALGGELDQRLARSRSEAAMVPESPAGSGRLLTQETIVLRTGRPVLAIAQDKAQLIFKPEDSQIWRDRLTAAEPLLTPAIRAVGRVEVSAHPDFSWIGTAWLVGPDVVATNRHVAREFGRANGSSFVFRTGTFGRKMKASIDFLEEFGSRVERVAKVREILHIEEEDGPDVAFLRIEGAELAPPIALAELASNAGQQIAVIGYPARDSRIPEQDLMEQIFGDVFDKKRLAPGQVKDATTAELLHDCSTLGGNSGSVVLDLASGKAVGIHFAGRFLEANFAVPAAVIAERLRAAERGESRPVTTTFGPARTVQTQSAAGGGMRISCTIPIHLTIEVGAPVLQPDQAIPSTPAATLVLPPREDEPGDDDDFAAESVPSDYKNRTGYQADFLGLGAPLEVPLPEIVNAADQILTFDYGGNPAESVLRYEHFSVIMRRDRRLCFYSAVNIDGSLARKEKRTGWTFDPRIPKAAQIREECYGNAPRFSRGHMTRREDPVWGTKETGARGNSDSMHVTNVVPQMQTFNAGIWLGLEDYALDNTKEDDMKVCVFTGPVFRDDDPVRDGVKIPRVFWKVIVFVHDETGKLCATGYSISQEKFLSETEFVFGAYDTHQRSLKWIEQQTGLSFGRATGLDLFGDVEEASPRPLRDFRQIRFFGKRGA
ncbi:MAG: DNA/RNA non-specific endonuclease, partial [Acidobacteriota bacterium]